MKKLILVMIINIIFSLNVYAGRTGMITCGVTTFQNYIPNGSGDMDILIMSTAYELKADAIAARNAWCAGSCQVTNDAHEGTLPPTVSYFDSTKWLGAFGRKFIGGKYYYRDWLYAANPGSCVTWDEDQDCKKYKPLVIVKDISLNCIYYSRIITEDCQILELGDASIFNEALSGSKNVTVRTYDKPMQNPEGTCDMGSDPMDCNSTWDNDSCTGIDMSKSDSNNSYKDQNISGGKYTQNQDLGDGTMKATGETDSTRLGKIVDNTGVIANNQQQISNQMTQLANLIQDQKSFDSEMSNQDVLNEMKNQEADAKQAYDNRNNTIQNADASQYEEQSKFNESDEYSNDIDQKIDNVSPDGTISGLAEKYHNNTYLQGFRNSQIEIIDSYCSIDMPFKVFDLETEIEINLCEFDDILTTVGNVFYYIVVIGSLITVLKGRGA